MFWVYVLQNPDGKFYVGQTDNLPVRVANHCPAAPPSYSTGAPLVGFCAGVPLYSPPPAPFCRVLPKASPALRKASPTFAAASLALSRLAVMRAAAYCA